LSHWFGLASAGAEPMTEKMPRPSAWNHFVTDSKTYEPEEQSEEEQLRSWTKDAGLPAESQFLSHWFGLSKFDEATAAGALPRPTPWNYFAGEGSCKIVAKSAEKAPASYELRQFAFDAGLAEESRFLSHWFGLASAGAEPMTEKMPRPSAWNHFVTDSKTYEPEEQSEEEQLRSWTKDAGLPAESQFLSHWFGLSKFGEATAAGALPRPTPWNYFASI